MQLNWKRAIVGGVTGTLVMTAVGVWIAPMMGIPRMNPAEMLAGPMGGSLILGWMAHLMIGSMLGIGYAVVAPWLFGAPAARGALYALAPWLLSQLAVTPMMGAPVFSGSFAMAMGSLFGHMIYGAIVGGIYGPVRSAHPRVSTA